MALVTGTLRLLGVVAAIGLVLAPPVAAGGATSPIQPGNQPTPIPGASNGYLPPADLVSVAPGCQVARAAAASLEILLAAARERGIPLGTEDCYRSLQGQQTEQQAWTAAGNSACAAPVVTSPSGQPQGTSMHGWGKAADFSSGPGSVGFGSAGYAFLKAFAGPMGWNHPAWAEPGGSACPEAWHWEWVGDGGTMGASPIRADVVSLLPSADGGGYASVSGLGALTARGDFRDQGSTATMPIAWTITGSASTPDGGGYWLVAADGGVFNFGDAPFLGSLGALRLNQPIVGIAATPTGRGYWLAAADGGVFSFGDAGFHGSLGSVRLSRPIVGMASTPDGGGYWLAAADGGVFSFGDAVFHGSAADLRLGGPVVGMARTPDGGGYWLAGADGGILTFGSAPFLGSGAAPRAVPVVSIVARSNGDGYWLVAADGAVLAFGAAPGLGSA